MAVSPSIVASYKKMTFSDLAEQLNRISALSLPVYAADRLALAARNFSISSPRGWPLVEPFALCHLLWQFVSPIRLTPD